MRSKLVVILTLALFVSGCAGFLASDRGNDAIPDQIAFRTASLELEPAGAPAAALALPEAGSGPRPALRSPEPPFPSFRC